MHMESIRGNNMRLFFNVGNRVLSMLQTSLIRDRALSTILSTGKLYVHKVFYNILLDIRIKSFILY